VNKDLVRDRRTQARAELRIGVIGGGYWGSKHVRVLHLIEEVKQVSVIDPVSDRLAELQRAFPSVLGSPRLDAVLSDLDAVIIATPPSTHRDLALTAIEAGKHVLVEKPLAITVADARTMVAAANQAGVVLMSGHTFEYNPAVLQLRDYMAAGVLGDIHYVDSARLNLGLYQRDVNVLWDLAPHDISICNFLLGERPTRVSAWGSAHVNELVEDVASLRLDYETIGVTATLRVSWLAPIKVRQVTVVGSEKMAVYDDLDENERLKIYDRSVKVGGVGAVHPRQPSYVHGSIVSPFIETTEPLLMEDRDFVESVTEGRQPRADGPKGLAVVEILEAAERSILEQRSIHLDNVGTGDDARAAIR